MCLNSFETDLLLHSGKDEGGKLHLDLSLVMLCGYCETDNHLVMISRFQLSNSLFISQRTASVFVFKEV